MFGLSLKTWSLLHGEEDIEFALILSEIHQIGNFLQLLFDNLQKHLSLDPITISVIQSQLHPFFSETRNSTIENWKSVPHFTNSIKEIPTGGSCTIDDNDDNINFVEFILEDENAYLNQEEIPSSGTSTLFCQVEGCNQRNISFKSQHYLKEHQRKEHAHFACLNCKHICRNETELTSHLCHKRHKCQDCGRDFSTSHELQSHCLIHTGAKPHMCDICGKYFRQRSTMERHKLTHQTHRDHECKICNKKFKYKHYLTTHMKIHEGNKPYVCTFCGLRFAQNGNMLKHIKQLHTPQEKSHVCKICNKAFVQPYYLRRHLKSHKGFEEERQKAATFDFIIEPLHTGSDEQCDLRTVACSLCNVTCKTEEDLDIHFTKHHMKSN